MHVVIWVAGILAGATLFVALACCRVSGACSRLEEEMD